jgi:hypothetical protein
MKIKSIKKWAVDAVTKENKKLSFLSFGLKEKYVV